MRLNREWNRIGSMLRRGLHHNLILAAAAWLAACGGSSNDSEPPPPAPAAVPSGQSATQTLGSAGGTVVLGSSDGAVFTLSVPAGALGADTVVGISTEPATLAQHFNLHLAPAGTVLAGGKAATLTIALPPSAAVPAAGGLHYGGVPVAFTRLADGRLQVQLTNFAPAATGAASGSRALGRAHALARPAAADPTGAVCAPDLSADAQGLTADDAVEIELYGQCMVASVNALAQNAEYAAAVRMASVTAAYLQATGQGDPARFIRQAGGIACIAYRDALDHALVTPVTTMGSLYAVLKPVLFWESTRQRLGAVCEHVGEGDFIEVTNAKTNEAAAFYASKKGAIVDTTGVEYTEAAQEAKAGHDTIVQVRSLQPAPALNNIVTVAIEQRAQPSLLDAILQAPWQRCRDGGDYTELLRLWETMDAAQPVKDAIQYCATQIGAQVRDASDAVSAVLSPGLGGIRVDLRNTSGTLAVNRDSKIELSGTIGVLACPASDTETLQLSFEGVEVATLDSRGAVLLGTDRTLPVLKASELLSKAGLRDDDSGTHALVIKRRNSRCAAALGITEEVLATVALEFGSQPLKVSIDAANIFHYQYRAPIGGVGQGSLSEVNHQAPNPSPFPLTFSTDGCCANRTGTMTLRLRDPKTVEWLDEYAMVAGVTEYSFGGDVVRLHVIFPKAGVATLTVNSGWFTSTQSCPDPNPDTPRYHPWENNRQQITASGQAVDYQPSAFLGVQTQACDDVIPRATTMSAPVAANSDWLFTFNVFHRYKGLMNGSGAAVTLHFEPTP